jgi:TRAP-type C4-dicarboxylate transport system permease small subunit
MKGVLDLIDKGIVLAGRAGLGLAGLCLILIMVIGTLDALMTNLLLSPLPSALELSEVLLAVTVFASLAATQCRNQHVRVDLLIEKAPRWLSTICRFLSTVVAAIVFGLIAWQASRLATESLAVRETASAVFSFPVYPAKLLVAVGAILVTAECLRRLVRHVVEMTDDGG